MTYWAYQSESYRTLDQLSIAINNAGFVYGVTVTDQCRTYGQRPFRLKDHLDRFQSSCKYCEVSCPASNDEITIIIEELMRRNLPFGTSTSEWSIVWLATPGLIGSFIGHAGGILDARPELLVYCFPLDEKRFAHYYQSGAEVRVTENVRSMPVDIHHPHAKQRSRLHWWLAEREVKKSHPQAQALLLDAQGHITETATSNVVLVRNGQLYSPKRTGILPGISLLVLEELCTRLGITFKETDLSWKDLQAADEAIICSTPFGIAPIGKLNDIHLPVNGPCFSRLWDAWQEMVKG